MFRTSWIHHEEDSLYTQLLYGMLTLPPPYILLTQMHKNIPYKKCAFNLSAWWWTHEVLNM